MNDLVSISRARISESKLLSVLFKTVYIDNYGIEGVTYEFANFLEKQVAPSKIEMDTESERTNLWVARDKNNPVGILQIEFNNHCPVKNELLTEINKLYILTHFLARGMDNN
uniref:hypothetical protein n=1 Tax=Roseivirga sp. TaxID=1964215 RepID=UPI004048117F